MLCVALAAVAAGAGGYGRGSVAASSSCLLADDGTHRIDKVI